MKNNCSVKNVFALSPEHREHGLLDNPWSYFFNSQLPTLPKNDKLSILQSIDNFDCPDQIRMLFSTVSNPQFQFECMF